jgi:putative endopeptidase
MKLKQLKTYFTVLGVAAASLYANAQNSPKKFIDPANMDLSVKPGDDFYQYASGTWIKNNPVPAKETRWGSFNELREFNAQAVKGLVETAATDKNAPAGSVTKRVGDFYAAAMDSLTIEKLGYTPIKADLEKIKKLNSIPAVLDHIAYMRTSGIGGGLFGLGVGQDRKNVTKYVVNISQGGTTLGDRDYYLRDDPQSKKIRAAYHTYMVKLFTLIGYTEAEATQKAETVFNIEKALAEAQMSRIEMRDQYKTYNKLTVTEFNKITPSINWSTLLPKFGITGQDTVLINSKLFFEKVNGLLTSVPVSDWKTYLEWNVVKGAANSLSSPFVNASFAFTQAQTGQKVATPRWQRMSALTDGAIGELLGQLYVAKYFKPDAKVRMDQMIVNLRKAFEIRINGLEWMSAETKKKALEKLHAFTPKVGYATKWQTYDGLQISRNSYFQNLRNVGVWAYKENITKLGKPVDRTRFGMTPPTVNAYYSPTLNEIVFPAGILQFPFFDPNADDAVNYGGIGAVIGHEMSHGFDDTGSQYDKDGNLKNWWTDEDRAKFNEKTKALGEQFNAYTVVDTIHVLGKLTMGENIGDLGGLNAAYTAFKMTKQGQSNEKIDGFTPDQRFFLSWAQVWRGNVLPETAAQLIKTDPHSPGPYRTIGAPVNMDAWYQAFDVKPGDKLYKKPEDRIRLW